MGFLDGIIKVLDPVVNELRVSMKRPVLVLEKTILIFS